MTRVDLDVGNIPKPVMSAFIALQLQNEHGDLGLDTLTLLTENLERPFKRSYPPLSSLGQSLMAGSAATALLKSLVESAEGNMTAALLRLDNVLNAERLSDIETVGDRLPANILSVFHRAISRIERDQARPGYSNADVRHELGTKALRFVGCHAGLNGMAFGRLKDALVMQQYRIAGHSPPPNEPDLLVEEVLGASAGLLVVNDTTSQIIRCYHTDLFHFVNENYSGELVGALNLATMS